MHIAVCDDTADVLQYIYAQVKGISFIDSVTPYNDFKDLITAVRTGKKYNVVLMDIDWGCAENGIDFASELFVLSPDIRIIFITGYPEKYSQQIFLGKVNLCGFLTKPINQEMLEKILSKALDESIVTVNKKINEKNLTVSFNGTITSFKPDDIFYVESKGRKAIIHSAGSDYICYEQLGALKSRLPGYFEFSHKSFLINMNYIKRIERDKLYLINEISLPISKGKLNDLKREYFSYIDNYL